MKLFGRLTEKRPLVYKLLAVEEYYNLYLDYCCKLNEWLKELDGGFFDEMWELLDVHAKNDPTCFYEYPRIKSEFNKNFHNGIAGFVHERTIYLTKRLKQLRPSNFLSTSE